MSEYGEYLVTGKRNYRGHAPGTIFEARLDRNAEARAVARGDIRLLRLVSVDIEREHMTFAGAWLPPPQPVAATDNHEAPDGAFFMDQGG